MKAKLKKTTAKAAAEKPAKAKGKTAAKTGLKTGADAPKLAEGEENLLPTTTAVETEVVEFAGEGDTFFHVIKGAHSAIVKGDSKADARQAFLDLYGIIATEEKVQVGEVDEDQLDNFRLNKFGSILPD